MFDLLDIKQYLSRNDQTVFKLMKSRQDLKFQLIGKLNGIHRIAVRPIFVYYTNIICHYHLNDVDFWPLKYISPNKYTAIIDFSVIVSNQSTKKPEQNTGLLFTLQT